MKLNIKLGERYKSFLPDFEAEIEGTLIIMSGVNGSGKTQLIDIIKGHMRNDVQKLIQRNLTQDGINVDSGAIISKSFRDYQNLGELTRASVSEYMNLRDKLYAWYKEHRLEHNQNRGVPAQVREAAKAAKELIIKKFSAEAFNAGSITRDELKTAIPSEFVLYDDDIFSNKVGELFFNYVSLVYKKKAEAGESGQKLDLSKLPPAPWVVLNQLFDKLKFDYRFKDNYLRVDDEIDEQPAIYQIKEDGTVDLSQRRALNELSDGEKALISLTFATIASDQREAKLLLLDEYDATLNPSLIENFFTILQEFFTDRGVQVIIITHSPATLSLAPANTIFYEVYKPNKEYIRILEVNRDQYNELAIANKKFYEKIADQQTRLTQLKEENDDLNNLIRNLTPSNNQIIQIITEGNNIGHIHKAISIIKPDLLSKIDFVKGAEHATGKNQMKTGFEIMSNLSSTHKLIFVWDVDAENMVKQLNDNSNCKKFCFPFNNENKKIPAGIENLYPESFFTDDLYVIKKTPRNDGGNSIQEELNKKGVLDKIEQQSDEELFKNFYSLIAEIESMI